MSASPLQLLFKIYILQNRIINFTITELVKVGQDEPAIDL